PNRPQSPGSYATYAPLTSRVDQSKDTLRVSQKYYSGPCLVTGCWGYEWCSAGPAPSPVPYSCCSARVYHPGVEGLAIHGRLQRPRRRVAQGSHGEAGRFGHGDELGNTLGRLLAVERQFGVNPVAPRLRIASEDGAGAS